MPTWLRLTMLAAANFIETLLLLLCDFATRRKIADARADRRRSSWTIFGADAPWLFFLSFADADEKRFREEKKTGMDAKESRSYNVHTTRSTERGYASYVRGIVLDGPSFFAHARP